MAIIVVTKKSKYNKIATLIQNNVKNSFVEFPLLQKISDNGFNTNIDICRETKASSPIATPSGKSVLKSVLANTKLGSINNVTNNKNLFFITTLLYHKYLLYV